jgi:hypothetical protein
MTLFTSKLVAGQTSSPCENGYRGNENECAEEVANE